MSYIISWFEQHHTKELQRRPWWNLLGKDSLLTKTWWQRRVITTPTRPDFETLKSVVRALGPTWHLQVEETSPPGYYTSPIATTGSPFDGAKFGGIKLRELRKLVIDASITEPQPPADGEVGKLVAWLRETGKLLHPDYSSSQAPYMRCADLLERRYPQPIPVAERPWERDGWCDAKGRCWWFNPGLPAMSNPHIATSSWRLCRMLSGKPMGTHCLPAHALPLPSTTEDNNEN